MPVIVFKHHCTVLTVIRWRQCMGLHRSVKLTDVLTVVCGLFVQRKVSTQKLSLVMFSKRHSTLVARNHFLCHIRASLPDDICLSLGTALIQSRLDYSYSVLYGTSVSNLHKLQMVQNALVALLVQSPHLSSFPISTGSLSISE